MIACNHELQRFPKRVRWPASRFATFRRNRRRGSDNTPNSAVASLEALVRSILDRAAEAAPPTGSFPHNLIALVEPGEDIEPFIREHRQPQEPVELT